MKYRIRPGIGHNSPNVGARIERILDISLRNGQNLYIQILTALISSDMHDRRADDYVSPPYLTLLPVQVQGRIATDTDHDEDKVELNLLVR